MNLLIVTEHFWPEGSGGALATYLVAKLLAMEKDFNITVITGTTKPARIDNVKFIVDPSLRASSKVELLLRLTNPMVEQRYEKVLKEFDILYIPSNGSLPLISVAKKLAKKVIVHLHGYQPFSYSSVILSGQNNSILTDISFEAKFELYEYESIKRAILGSMLTPTTYLYRLWVRQADKIICVSRRQAEIIAKKAPELKHKIRVVYNPPPSIPLASKILEEPTFLYLGGDSYIKGFHVLLGAGWRILKRHRDARILLTKSFKGSKRVLLEKLNKLFNGAFKLLGHLDYNSVLGLHSISYALLFPSIWEEPFGYAVVESMLAGTIPIASRVGGVPEIVEDTPAEKLMFTPGDIDEFVDRIELVLSMSKEQLIDAGYRLRDATLRKFNEERVRRELLRVFTA